MGEAKRRAELMGLKDFNEDLRQQIGADVVAAAKPALPPEIQRIANMEPGARQAIFNIDLAQSMLASMANQLVIAGRPDLANPFAQMAQALPQLRAQVLLRESGAGLVIAQPGDVPAGGVARTVERGP